VSALTSIPTPDQATRLRRLVEIGQPAPTLALRPARRAKVITISSGKGGVGKTGIAVNLAIALQARGVRTTLVDLDLGLANADLLCGLNPAARLDRAAIEGTPLDQLSILAPGGFRLVPGSVGLVRGEETGGRALARLEELDASTDVLIIDTGAGMGATVRSALHAADLALLVATPEPTSIADAYALIKVTCQGEPHASGSDGTHGAQFLPGLVVNQCTDDAEAQEVHHRIASVARRFLGRDIPLLGMVPSDPAVQRAVRERRPLLLSGLHTPAAAAIATLAHGLSKRLEVEAFAPPPPGRPTTVWRRLAGLLGGRVD